MTIQEEREKLLKKIGARLEKARHDMGLTRYQVSQATGVQETHLKKIEEGSYSMRIDTLNRLCEYYGIEIILPLEQIVWKDYSSGSSARRGKKTIIS